MPSVSDVPYTQRAANEVFTEEKETVGNTHKRLCKLWSICCRQEYSSSLGTEGDVIRRRLGGAPRFVAVGETIHGCRTFNVAASWWCHSRGQAHYDSAFGAEFVNKQRKCGSSYPQLWVLKSVCKRGP